MILNKYLSFTNKELSVSKVDDLLIEIHSLGISDIYVNKTEMHVFVCFYVANAQQDKNSGVGEVLKENKVKRLFGVNIHELSTNNSDTENNQTQKED